MKSPVFLFFYRRLLVFWAGMVVCGSIWATDAASMGYVEDETEGHTSVLWTARGHRYMKDGDYEAALACFKRGEKEFAADHDTIDKRFITGFLAPQADVLRLLGRSDEALAVAYRIFYIRDSLSARSHSSNQDRADVIGESPIGTISTSSVVLSTLGVVAVVAVFGILWRYNRQIRAKNKVLLSTVERLRKGLDNDTAEKDSEEPSVQPQSRQKKDADEQLFVRLTDMIVSKKMYLTPNLSREDVIVEVYVPKNKFASLFQRYAGMSFTSYINNLRVDNAKQQIREHPEYTFECIASESGMGSLQTFNRVFRECVGMTPSEYRQQMAEK